MRLPLVALIVAILVGPSPLHAMELNAGFVEGLWYSSEEVFADTPVRVYVAIRNNTEHDLTGTVRFTDNGERIGTSLVSALPGRLVEAWADWTPSSGEHTLAATLKDVKLHEVGERPQPVTLISMAAEETLTVDYDTDGDGIGNSTDTDDDDDGISDEEEVARGTDPLVYTESMSDDGAGEEEEDGGASPRQTEHSTAEPREGLEQYVGDGVIHGLLSNVTEKVTRAKRELDSYREKRTGGHDPEFDTETETVTSTTSTIQPLAQPVQQATITRTQIDGGPGFVSSVIGAFAAIVGGLYTLTLWVLSGLLSHPALVQLVFLILVLAIVYKVARRLGRRQPPN